MFDQKDFVPKTLSVHWLKGIQTESFDSAIAAANEWIKAESIDVLNFETIVIPVGPNDETESPNITGVPVSLRGCSRITPSVHSRVVSQKLTTNQQTTQHSLGLLALANQRCTGSVIP